MASKYLPEDSHVVRHLSSRDFDIGDAGDIVIFPHAFELRSGEKYLSAAWLEFFAEPFLDCISAVASAISKTRKVGQTHAFALGEVRVIKAACAEYELKIRVIHEPNEDNPAYVAVRSYKSEPGELLDLLARQAWSRFVDIRSALGRFGPWNKR